MKPAKSQSPLVTDTFAKSPSVPIATDAFWAKLKEWGVTDEALRQRFGLKLLTREEVQVELGYCKGIGTIEIPYFNVHGERQKFARYRFLGEFSGGKYVQNLGGIEIYLPKLAGTTWSAVAHDTKQPIIITEGEGKAICAAILTDIAVLALGGVFNFRSRTELLSARRSPLLDEAHWRVRSVFIAFDYTVKINPNVQMAQAHLAAWLRAAGAKVYFLNVGELDPTRDWKLDEYLLAGGKLKELMARTKEAGEGVASLTEWQRAVDMVASEFVHCGGEFIKIATLEKYSRQRLDNYFSDRKFENPLTGKRVNPSTAWADSPHRINVEGITFRPGEDNIITHDGYLNTWRGFQTQPKAGDVTPFLKLLDDAFAYEGEEAKQWWFRKIAHLFQHPGVKQFSIDVFINSKQGVGKSTLPELITKIMGLRRGDINPFGVGAIFGPSELKSEWTDWADGALYAVFNEPSNHGDDVSNQLKALATSEVIRVNKKFGMTRDVPNHAHLALTSNDNYTHRIDPDSRREFVVRIEVNWTAEQWEEFYKWFDGHKGEILAYFLSVGGVAFNPKAPPPMTKSKGDMANMSQTPTEQWVREAIEDRQQELFLLQEEVCLFAGVERSNAVQEQRLIAAFHRTRMVEKLFAAQRKYPCAGKQLSVWVHTACARKWRDAPAAAVLEKLKEYYPMSMRLIPVRQRHL